MRKVQEAGDVTAVWLGRRVLKYMEAEATRKLPNETGGVLIGYTVDGAAVLQHAVGPGPAAIHERSRFVPDYEFHTREVAKYYEASGQQCEYLGDWHSHPSGLPTLSRQDLRTMRGIASSRAARCPRPLMLIVSSETVDGHWLSAAWMMRRRPTRCLPLEMGRFEVSSPALHVFDDREL